VFRLLLWAIAAIFRPKTLLIAENLCLRQQLLVLQRRYPGPRLSNADRRFWILASRWFGGWRRPLRIVRPETVLRWHRRGWRAYWTRLSHRPVKRGRRPLPQELFGLGRPAARSSQSLYLADCITFTGAPHDGPYFCALHAMPADALAVHGLTDEFDKPLLPAAVLTILVVPAREERLNHSELQRGNGMAIGVLARSVVGHAQKNKNVEYRKIGTRGISGRPSAPSLGRTSGARSRSVRPRIRLPAVSLVPIYLSFCWQRLKLRIKTQVVADRWRTDGQIWAVPQSATAATRARCQLTRRKRKPW
jgi:hypothetical protein